MVTAYTGSAAYGTGKDIDGNPGFDHTGVIKDQPVASARE